MQTWEAMTGHRDTISYENTKMTQEKLRRLVDVDE